MVSVTFKGPRSGGFRCSSATWWLALPIQTICLPRAGAHSPLPTTGVSGRLTGGATGVGTLGAGWAALNAGLIGVVAATLTWLDAGAGALTAVKAISLGVVAETDTVRCKSGFSLACLGCNSFTAGS